MNLTTPWAFRLALFSVLAGLALGGLGVGLGLTGGATVLWGFGAVWVLQVPPTLSLGLRIREDFGNRGLARERNTLRVTSHLLRLLALGLAVAAGADLLAGRGSQASRAGFGYAGLAVAVLAALWLAKRGLADRHPALALDAARTRTLLELAALALVGCLLGRWFIWADAGTGLVLALRMFSEGTSLARATTLQAACGGCGGGCG